MATTLRVIEDDPETRPAVPGAVATVPAGVVWRRLEGWANHRWGVRSVAFIVGGSGVWEPRLRPATFVSAEAWRVGEWEACEVGAHPLGYQLPDNGDDPLRLTFTVGEATASETVQEAFRRLAAYMAEAERELAAGSATYASGGDGDFRWTRSASWVARALHNSGAADLLRGYRYMGA